MPIQPSRAKNKTKENKTSSLNSSSKTGGTAEDDGKPSEDFYSTVSSLRSMVESLKMKV